MHDAVVSWILRLPTKGVGILRMTRTGAVVIDKAECLTTACHPERSEGSMTLKLR